MNAQRRRTTGMERMAQAVAMAQEVKRAVANEDIVQIPNDQDQITNRIQCSITKFQFPSRIIDAWRLEFVWTLVLVIWDLCRRSPSHPDRTRTSDTPGPPACAAACRDNAPLRSDTRCD